jgi:hypothetical protein
MHVSSQQRFSKNLMRRKMIDGILDSFTWLLLLLWHTCQCTECTDCKNKNSTNLYADIEEDEDVEDLQSRLCERDAALEVTRDAMENLTKLIKCLISGVGGGGLDGLGFSAIATVVIV